VSNLKNNPKGYLEYQKIIIGSWITIGDPSVAEIMAKGGFD
jgi:2-keto-3-deoxy-L-rhamnonate aldolase RhmA